MLTSSTITVHPDAEARSAMLRSLGSRKRSGLPEQEPKSTENADADDGSSRIADGS